MRAGPDIESLISLSVREFPELPTDRLRTYLREVLSWNTQLGLISKRDPLGVCARMVRQSVELWRVVSPLVESPVERMRVVDIGSGAGFPGMVWALLEPDMDLLLIERRSKKAAFLQKVARTLELSTVEVFGGDALDAARLERLRGVFDIAVSIAVGPPRAAGPLARAFLARGGLYTGSSPATQAVIPVTASEELHLEAEILGTYGRYLVYRKSR